MTKKPDPKEDPNFKAVVQHFLNTKPKPHAGKKNRPPKPKAAAAKE
jgi:hypothetical protein